MAMRETTLDLRSFAPSREPATASKYESPKRKRASQPARKEGREPAARKAQPMERAPNVPAIAHDLAAVVVALPASRCVFETRAHPSPSADGGREKHEGPDSLAPPAKVSTSFPSTSGTDMAPPSVFTPTRCPLRRPPSREARGAHPSPPPPLDILGRARHPRLGALDSAPCTVSRTCGAEGSRVRNG